MYEWVGFSILILLMVAIDAGLIKIGSQPPQMTRQHAIKWSCIWVGLSGLFALVIYIWQGPQAALEYCSGYVIEKSLSLDNIFVFIVIFSHFAIPIHLQHRILMFGVLSAIILRGLFITIGISLINAFDWIYYIFGAILIVTSVKMITTNDDSSHSDISGNKLLIGLRRYLPLTQGFRGEKFFVKEHGKWLATPLLLVLIFIEFSDILFAFDSIPAIFAVTRDPFIVFTSNIFAIMGLRALYFVLVDSMQKFHYLNYGIGSILLFVGVKLLLNNTYHFSIVVSLCVIIGILLLTVMASTLKKRSSLTKN